MCSAKTHLCMLSVLFVFVAVTNAPANGATFYVDPVNGSMTGDGSQADPWSTLAAVFSNNKIESQKPAVYPYDGTLTTRNAGAPVKAGDTLVLLGGDHGSIIIQGWFNSSTITIEAASGETPVLQRWELKGGKNWKLKGLTVSPEPYGTVSSASLIWCGNHSWHGDISDIVIEDCTCYTVDDASNWTATDWNTKAAGTGIYINGDDCTVRDNTIRNINFGINCSGDDLLAEGNTIEHICGDGMRGGGDRITFQYNTIRYFYDVDDNHDDAIQFYRGGGVAHNDVIIRGNFINGIPQSGVSLSTSPQGIGCFDGPYVDWLVENNVVLVKHYHGISVYDSTRCTIVNNTVLDTTGTYAAWITLAGTTTSGVSRNNMSTSLPSGSGITSSNNLDLDTVTWSNTFTDYANFDVTLKSGSAAIDAGTSTDAPSVDIDGTSRPQGSGYDIGAYEYASSASNAAPSADAGADQTVTDSDDSGAENVTLDGSGSSDSDGTIASYVWKENSTQIATGSAPTVSFSVGTHSVELTVTDDDSATDSDTVSITVNAYANVAPTADAGSDQTATDTDGNGSASVTLDGSGSADSDGTIDSYVWKIGGTQIATGQSPSVTLDVGVHTVDLTVTDDDDDTDSDSVEVTVVSWTVTSSTSYSVWPAADLPTQTGVFTLEFDATPNAANIDGVTGISSGAGDWWSDLACIVRFNTSGYIDVRDGGSYTADATLAYSSGTDYHVRMVIDVPNTTYSVYVTPDGGSQTTLATDYDFRTEQQSVTSLDSWTLNATNSVGTHTVSNLTITD